MAELQKIFQPNQTARGIRDDKLGNVRKRVGNAVLKTFPVKMKVWAKQSFVCAIRGIRRISVGRAIQIQASENNNLSSASLVF